ncbi:9463_t:CDS:2 [Funneliformis geosporum]|nr:9463_t:CDS:2 [Funneliformis geosporum]
MAKRKVEMTPEKEGEKIRRNNAKNAELKALNDPILGGTGEGDFSGLEELNYNPQSNDYKAVQALQKAGISLDKLFERVAKGRQARVGKLRGNNITRINAPIEGNKLTSPEELPDLENYQAIRQAIFNNILKNIPEIEKELKKYSLVSDKNQSANDKSSRHDNLIIFLVIILAAQKKARKIIPVIKEIGINQTGLKNQFSSE